MTRIMTVAELEPLMTLAEGAQRIGLTASALRTEIRKGRLTPTVVAGRNYVTDSALGEMLKRCRAAQKAPASISSPGRDTRPSGSSEIANGKLAQAAAKQTLEALKNGSLSTSPKSTNRKRTSRAQAES